MISTLKTGKISFERISLEKLKIWLLSENTAKPTDFEINYNFKINKTVELTLNTQTLVTRFLAYTIYWKDC